MSLRHHSPPSHPAVVCLSCAYGYEHTMRIFLTFFWVAWSKDGLAYLCDWDLWPACNTRAGVSSARILSLSDTPPVRSRFRAESAIPACFIPSSPTLGLGLAAPGTLSLSGYLVDCRSVSQTTDPISYCDETEADCTERHSAEIIRPPCRLRMSTGRCSSNAGN